mgnify:CR=1 FL=1|tara:strand:- start:282 stop:557 length:276 start_codon:yes stop_codon:yes gene_type:complete
MSKLKEECSCDKCSKGIKHTGNLNPFSRDELDFFILREVYPMSIRERVDASWRRVVIDSEEEHRVLHDGNFTFFQWNSTRGLFTCRICGLN